jgi:hypothetical protein
MQYLFVDGAYLRTAMEDWGRKWFNEPAIFNTWELGGGYGKVFYYDALPTQMRDETDADFEDRKARTANAEGLPTFQ